MLVWTSKGYNYETINNKEFLKIIESDSFNPICLNDAKIIKDLILTEHGTLMTIKINRVINNCTVKHIIYDDCKQKNVNYYMFLAKNDKKFKQLKRIYETSYSQIADQAK
jgi:hypothetical protein